MRDAKPALWRDAADDLLALAEQAERTAGNIHANGIKELESSWADHTGSIARETLVKIAHRVVNVSILTRGAVTALRALQDAIVIAQRELHAAVDFADRAGLVVDDGGRVGFPAGAVRDPLLLIDLMNTQRMIANALEGAGLADQACLDALVQVTVDPDAISKEEAQARQSDAVSKALQELRDQLPDGSDPAQVKQWWRALTPQQQRDLMRALPVELYNLAGIPESVKKQLADEGRGYNSVKAVQWALANADNDDIDVFDNNCANFTSHALRGGGLKDKMDFWSWGTLDSDNWGTSTAGDLNTSVGAGVTHTKSWYNADAQRKFLLDHGGSRVSLAQAKPGDIAYFNYADGSGGSPDGTSHHAAVVTAVLPDGEVLYTQHSPDASNLSLQDRMPAVETAEGRQDLTIVRPKQTW
ncbi:amidase domain-containing protein [Nocardia sp. CA2R105]|uniref:amidase domain-containing protein n=1 Tax=Nocardia coffeae TaxID=2873381 RepID=UPI001CA6420A|nr:amidase domain-containing protein [Nocardia coffeae]MBY8857667.1 amidase domain-containing protein [Nocardia coffeae]